MELEQQIQDLRSRVNDLETIRNPEEVVGRVILLEQALDEVRTAISELSIKLNAYLNEEKYIETFTDEEFKELYNNSGLVAKDIAKLIEKKFPEYKDTSAPTISKIMSGERGSIELRSYLGKVMRFESAKRKV